MYSLNNLDEKMLKYLNFNNGFFVEAGANDGISQSNTLMYEKKLNWTGLLIEPSPNKFKQCQQNRPNCLIENYALVNDSYSEDFIKGDFGYDEYGLSLCGQVTVTEDYFDEDLKVNLERKNKESLIINVPCTTIKKLFEKNNIKHVDFFSLDVEGYEIEALSGFDFNNVRPKYFLIETGNEYRYDLISNFMINKNYKILEKISDVDTLYIDEH